MDTLDKCSAHVFEILHTRHAAAGAAAAPAQPAVARPSSKLSSSELKPNKLHHDSSTSVFCTWKKQFKAYYNAAQLHTLPCSQQQAYSNNCLDDSLRASMDREATGTTPVFSPIVGLNTCMKILDGTFLETYPFHVRRKQFFYARQ